MRNSVCVFGPGHLGIWSTEMGNWWNSNVGNLQVAQYSVVIQFGSVVREENLPNIQM